MSLFPQPLIEPLLNGELLNYFNDRAHDFKRLVHDPLMSLLAENKNKGYQEVPSDNLESLSVAHELVCAIINRHLDLKMLIESTTLSDKDNMEKIASLYYTMRENEEALVSGVMGIVHRAETDDTISQETMDHLYAMADSMNSFFTE